MNRTQSAIVALALLTACSVSSAAHADIISQTDNVLIQSWGGNSPASMPAGGSATPAPPGFNGTQWYDIIGAVVPFETTQLTLNRGVGTSTISAATNMPFVDGAFGNPARTVLMADLFITLPGGTTYAVASTTRGGFTQGSTYLLGSALTSQDVWGSIADVRYGGRWDVCSAGTDCTNPQLAPVLINTGSLVSGTSSVTRTPPGSATPAVVEWVLPITIPDGSVIFWGTADCANDAIRLVVPTPEPVSAGLFGLGLLALGAAARRHGRTAG
jgi:hypothetical protein